jgi:prolyl 4-hydroxylase
MILILDNVLSSAECVELITIGARDLKSAQTLGKHIDGYRTADNSWVYEDTLLTRKLKEIVSKHTGTPIENQEKVHIVRYEINGEYKPHHDYFHPGSEYFDSVMSGGGQRTHTALFYLNDDFTGGQTEFPNRDIKITPKTGRLLIWRNTNEDGSLYDDSYHAGLPVIEGTKWISIIWVREKEFGIVPIIPKVTSLNLDLGIVLDDKECKKYSKLVLVNKDTNQLSLETDSRYYNNSYGGVLPFLWKLMEQFRPLVEEKVGGKVENANPYVRIYNNQSTLNAHTDREGLDYTVSICLYENINKEWDLNVKTESGYVHKFPTKIGYGSLISGRLLEHWRTPLECNDGEYVIQLFLHYKKI